MRQVEIRLLGRFEVLVDARPVPAQAWPQRRAADLVKVLALARRHRMARDEVLESLWPGLGVDAAASNLHKAASYARRALGARDAIVLRSGMVELAPEAEVTTDVERFERGDDSAYGGELLPDDPYANWALAARARLRAAIQVPDGNKPYLVGHAVGVQIYACNPTADGYAWSLVAPRATLYGDNGKPIATHYAGPTWQATDGSTVIGRREAGVTVDPTAVPWLLLSAASTAAGPDGARLAETTYIQRINTTGGVTPPAADCTAATLGTVNEVPYTADYYFWKAQAR